MYFMEEWKKGELFNSLLRRREPLTKIYLWLIPCGWILLCFTQVPFLLLVGKQLHVHSSNAQDTLHLANQP